MSDRVTSDRVAMFVDVQNMFYSAKHLHGSKVNYTALMDNVVDGRQLVRATAYLVQRPGISQDRFIDALSRMGYEVKVKVQNNNKTDAKGNMIKEKISYELSVGINAIQLANKVDTIVLVTGDGAYVELVSYLQSLGCKVEIVGFDRSTSGELIKTADRYIKIDPNWLMPINNKPDDAVDEPEVNGNVDDDAGNAKEEEPLPPDDIGNKGTPVSGFGVFA